MENGTVLVKVSELKAAKPYGEAGLIVNLINDILFEINLPDDTYRYDVEGNLIVTDKGIRHINKTLKTLLYWDQNEEF